MFSVAKGSCEEGKKTSNHDGSKSSSLEGSWVVISRVISRVTKLVTHIRLITLRITTPEPPSRRCDRAIMSM